jgi:hypothetical protein
MLESSDLGSRPARLDTALPSRFAPGLVAMSRDERSLRSLSSGEISVERNGDTISSAEVLRSSAQLSGPVSGSLRM